MTPVLSQKHWTKMKVFLVLNTLAFCSSLSISLKMYYGIGNLKGLHYKTFYSRGKFVQ
jgi:hypothetical protein